MRIIKFALAALLAVMAFSAMAASSASAHPLFLTESGKELLVLGHGGPAILRGSAGTVLCELVLIHGWVLNKSPLIHRLRFLFEGKCELHPILGSLRRCTEPIHVHFALGELGLVLGNKTVGIYIEPSEGAPEFVEIICETEKIKVNGAVIGEIPEKVGAINQYNKPLSAITSVFEAENKNAKQKITEIELLGVNMTGVHLETTGFFAGEASEEATGKLEGDGKVEICTLADSACP